MRTSRVYWVSIRILALSGLIFISIGTFSLIGTRVISTKTASQKTTSPSKNEATWADQIGTISLLTSDIANLLSNSPNVKEAQKVVYNYYFSLNSNIPGISFSPQKGKLSSEQGDWIYVAILGDHSTSSGWLASNFINGDLLSYSLSSTSVSGVTIMTSLPTVITQNQSFKIDVSITATSQSSQDPTPSSSDQSQASTTTNILSASGTPIQQAFGSGYNFFVNPAIYATAFSAFPQEQKEQPLDQTTDDFPFVLTPTASGLQTLTIPIIGTWVAKKGGQIIQHILAAPTFHVNVLSNPSLLQNASSDSLPLFSIGQITLGGLLTILIGSLLDIPLVLEILRKKQKTAQHAVPAQQVVVVVKQQKTRRRRNNH